MKSRLTRVTQSVSLLKCWRPGSPLLFFGGSAFSVVPVNGEVLKTPAVYRFLASLASFPQEKPTDDLAPILNDAELSSIVHYLPLA